LLKKSRSARRGGSSRKQGRRTKKRAANLFGEDGGTKKRETDSGTRGGRKKQRPRGRKDWHAHADGGGGVEKKRVNPRRNVGGWGGIETVPGILELLGGKGMGGIAEQNGPAPGGQNKECQPRVKKKRCAPIGQDGETRRRWASSSGKNTGDLNPRLEVTNALSQKEMVSINQDAKKKVRASKSRLGQQKAMLWIKGDQRDTQGLCTTAGSTPEKHPRKEHRDTSRLKRK